MARKKKRFTATPPIMQKEPQPLFPPSHTEKVYVPKPLFNPPDPGNAWIVQGGGGGSIAGTATGGGGGASTMVTSCITGPNMMVSDHEGMCHISYPNDPIRKVRIRIPIQNNYHRAYEADVLMYGDGSILNPYNQCLTVPNVTCVVLSKDSKYPYMNVYCNIPGHPPFAEGRFYNDYATYRSYLEVWYNNLTEPMSPTPLQFDSKKAKPASNAPAPLNLPVTSPKKAPVVAAPLFGDNSTPESKKGSSFLEQNYAELYASEKFTLDNKVKQLTPFTFSVTTQWGQAPLDAQTKMVSSVAALVHSFSSMNANEALEDIIKEAKEKSSIFTRMLGKHSTVDDKKFLVIQLRDKINSMTPLVDIAYSEAMETQRKLLIYLASMGAAIQVQRITDSTIQTAVDNRNRLLVSANQQAQLLIPQLDQIRQQISGILNKIDITLNLTLPAIELANAAQH